MTAAVTFIAETHDYYGPDGRWIPSVTQILKSVGVARDFDELALISAKVADSIEEARALGSVVHADTHAYDDGDLVWSSLDKRSEPFVEAWATCRQNMGLVPVTRERRIYHPIWEYAGTYDGIFIQQSTGKRILPDLKIGDPADAGGPFQTAAYEGGYYATYPDPPPIDERWAIQLCPELRVPYRITNYSDYNTRPDAWQDFQKFQAFIVTYREQHAARRRAA